MIDFLSDTEIPSVMGEAEHEVRSMEWLWIKVANMAHSQLLPTMHRIYSCGCWELKIKSLSLNNKACLSIELFDSGLWQSHVWFALICSLLFLFCFLVSDVKWPMCQVTFHACLACQLAGLAEWLWTERKTYPSHGCTKERFKRLPSWWWLGVDDCDRLLPCDYLHESCNKVRAFMGVILHPAFVVVIPCLKAMGNGPGMEDIN